MQLISSRVVDKRVISVAAVTDVVALEHVERVVARRAVDEVGASQGLDGVVALEAAHGVVAGAALEEVGPGVAHMRVGARKADAGTAVDVLEREETRRQIEVRRQRDRRLVDAVVVDVEAQLV